MTDEIYLRACVGPEGLYSPGEIDTAIPWPDILRHAPVAELVAEMERRKFQVKSEDDQYNDWAEAREADE
jgi:hypothetical protein